MTTTPACPERPTSVPTSQPSTLNPQLPSALTYPARPIEAGPLLKSGEKTGEWLYQPTYAGQTVMIHGPSGTLFNEHGGRLDSAPFHHALRQIRSKPFQWLHATVQQRAVGVSPTTGAAGNPNRQDAGGTLPNGTIIITDWINSTATTSKRQQLLDRHFLTELITHPLASHHVYLAPHYKQSMAEDVWELMQKTNEQFGWPMFEGFIAKKSDSLYPIQIDSPEQSYAFWMRHGF